MPSLDDVYRKYGEVSEAAQLLETELGNLLLSHGASDADLFTNPNVVKASHLLEKIDRQTLGQLIANTKDKLDPTGHIESLLSKALVERNRLIHSFYRQHNLRRNSEQGQRMMLADLDAIHDTILEAYKTVLLLSGVDLDKMAFLRLPMRHVPI